MGSHFQTLLQMPTRLHRKILPWMMTSIPQDPFSLRQILKNAELQLRLGHEDVREAERILNDNIDDCHSDLEGEEEENPDEDGEGGFLDAEDDEGYAAL